MFRVNSKFQYIHHYVSSKEIAEAIRDDLASREDCVHSEEVVVEDCNESAKWDPGGSLWIGDKKHTFSLKGIDIEVYFQHINSFEEWVWRSHKDLRDWNGVKYHKIHSGYLFCVCVSPDELDELIKQFDVELDFKASASEEEFDRRMHEAGVLRVADIKDADGNEKRVVLKPDKPILH